MSRPYLSQFVSCEAYKAAFAEWKRQNVSVKPSAVSPDKHLVTNTVPATQRNGKWNCGFETWVEITSQEPYLLSTCTSVSMFDSKEEAEDAGRRALKLLDETGRFPNLCRPW